MTNLNLVKSSHQISSSKKVYTQFQKMRNFKIRLNISYHQFSEVQKPLYDVAGTFLSFPITHFAVQFEYLLLLPQLSCL